MAAELQRLAKGHPARVLEAHLAGAVPKDQDVHAGIRRAGVAQRLQRAEAVLPGLLPRRRASLKRLDDAIGDLLRHIAARFLVPCHSLSPKKKNARESRGRW